MTKPEMTIRAVDPPCSPASSTSAQAVLREAERSFLTTSPCRRGIIISTPSTPPSSATREGVDQVQVVEQEQAAGRGRSGQGHPDPVFCTCSSSTGAAEHRKMAM
jgi:hypothetical protein